MKAVTVRRFLPIMLTTVGICHAMGLSPEPAAGTLQVQAPSGAGEVGSGNESGAATGAGPSLDGADVYAGKCQFCHGPNMVTPGGGSFDLRKFPLDDRQRFETSILKGKNAMPAWQGIITPAEIDALWTYLRTRGRKP